MGKSLIVLMAAAACAGVVATQEPRDLRPLHMLADGEPVVCREPEGCVAMTVTAHQQLLKRAYEAGQSAARSSCRSAL
jgi:hypothetical protein